MRGFRIIACIAVIAVSGAATPVRADVDSAPNPPVRTAITAEGLVFVTNAGMTLYTYAPDDDTPGKSNCLAVPRTDFPDPTAGFGRYTIPMAASHKSCVEKSPPLLADEHAKSGGEWSLIQRPEGGEQWAYRGHPLHTSTKDRKPGDVNGAVDIGQLRGWRLAMAPLNFPPGFQLIRRAEGLVLATKNDRPVYTPAGAKLQKACAGCGEHFPPLAAPAIGTVDGDWSIVDAGAGRSQYAFKGLPLHAAPESLSNAEIAEEGRWRTVIFQEAAGTPPGIETRLSLLGDVYADKTGRTLYVFTCSTQVRDGVHCDDPGDAAVYWSALCGEAEDCARRWRPYVAAADARAVGDWSVVDVAVPMFKKALGPTYPADVPRVKAWAFKGRPVYTYFQDKEAGDIWGHSLRWWGFSGFYAVEVPGRGLLD